MYQDETLSAAVALADIWRLIPDTWRLAPDVHCSRDGAQEPAAIWGVAARVKFTQRLR
jgi:hypothetical protein